MMKRRRGELSSGVSRDVDCLAWPHATWICSVSFMLPLDRTPVRLSLHHRWQAFALVDPAVHFTTSLTVRVFRLFCGLPDRLLCKALWQGRRLGL